MVSKSKVGQHVGYSPWREVSNVPHDPSLKRRGLDDPKSSLVTSQRGMHGAAHASSQGEGQTKQLGRTAARALCPCYQPQISVTVGEGSVFLSRLPVEQKKGTFSLGWSVPWDVDTGGTLKRELRKSKCGQGYCEAYLSHPSHRRRDPIDPLRMDSRLLASMSVCERMPASHGRQRRPATARQKAGLLSTG